MKPILFLKTSAVDCLFSQYLNINFALYAELQGFLKCVLLLCVMDLKSNLNRNYSVYCISLLRCGRAVDNYRAEICLGVTVSHPFYTF